MKIIHLPLLGILLFSLFITSCKRDGGRGIFCIKPKGSIITETITPEAFSSVRMMIPAKTYIENSNTFSIEVKGHENILKNIDYEIKDGELKIKFDRCVRKLDELPQFTIKAPLFYGFYVMGSGSVETLDTLRQSGNSIHFEISGSGDIYARVQASKVHSKISGSGSIRLHGSADEVEMRISGSGDISAFELPVRKGDVEISGSGNANINASDYLKVKISGSGNVNYMGNPVIELDNSGSGKIRKVN